MTYESNVYGALEEKAVFEQVCIQPRSTYYKIRLAKLTNFWQTDSADWELSPNSHYNPNSTFCLGLNMVIFKIIKCPPSVYRDKRGIAIIQLKPRDKLLFLSNAQFGLYHGLIVPLQVSHQTVGRTYSDSNATLWVGLSSVKLVSWGRVWKH